MAKSIIVSYEPTNREDAAVLVVGEKQPKMDVKIINAFQGKEATELWERLTTKKWKNTKNSKSKIQGSPASSYSRQSFGSLDERDLYYK